MGRAALGNRAVGDFLCVHAVAAESASRAAAMRWLLWALLFKLMFLSGITKIVSQDKTWADWTALLHHYETQPIPTWTSWFAHHLPEWFHKSSIVGMYFIELVVPFLIFVPSRIRVVRWVACGFLVLLQLLIAATGNYGFFNWLTIVLCVLLLDDALWQRVWAKRMVGRLRRLGRPSLRASCQASAGSG